MAASVLPILALRAVPPVTSAFMVRRDLGLDAGGRCARVEYQWVDWDGISPWLALAFAAGEDQRFPDHAGFDLRSIRDAIAERRAGRVRGASTISQQVAKNLFLWPGRSWLRKGLEAWLTAWIELLWPKQRILEVYLNVSQLGPCTFGVEAASRRFFRRPAERLGPHESALLAAVLPDPVGRRVEAPSPLVRRRASWIEGQMRRLGGTDWLARLEPGR